MTGKRVEHKMVITCDRDHAVHAVIHCTPRKYLSSTEWAKKLHTVFIAITFSTFNQFS